jgi:hypothetical protein
MGKINDFYNSASFDGVVKNVTIALWILLISESVFFIYLFLVIIPFSALSLFFALLMPSISIIVLVIPYLFKPKGFRLTSKELKIERLLKPVTVPYVKISNIQMGKWTWKAIRLGGSGGLYGYFGLFHFFGIGRVWMYATNRHKMVLIVTKQGKKYGLSPENPEDFITELQKHLIE